MEWLLQLLAFLPQVFEMISACTDDEADRAKIAKMIKNPGPFQLRKLALAVKEEKGWRGREWLRNRGRTIRGIRDELQALSDEEALLLYDDTLHYMRHKDD